MAVERDVRCMNSCGSPAEKGRLTCTKCNAAQVPEADYAKLFREAVSLLWATTARIQHLDVRAFLRRDDVNGALDALKDVGE